MRSTEKNFSLSKKDQRDVTSFVGHELLYDYICGCLDKERQSAVETFLKNSPTADQDYKKIQKGLDYAEKLAHTIVAQPILDQISEPPTYLSELLKKSNFDKWPIGVKWGLEALIIISFIAVFLIIVPWDKALRVAIIPHSKEIVLAEVTREQKEGDPEKLKQIEKTEPPQFEDEELKKQKSEVAAAVPTSSIPEPAKVKVQAAVAPDVPTATNLADHKAETKKASEGFLYRGVMKAANIQVVGPQITDKIVALGGRKAGEVELGWNKTPASAYYHFTIPESKMNDLNKFLSGYGKIKLIKEKHPRVMPDGIIRLILTVEESSQ